MSRPTSVLIDREAARRNLATVATLCPGSRVLAVVKADAYGHGMSAMAAAFRAADALGVATLDEAARLREGGWSGGILLLEGVHHPADLFPAEQLGCALVVHRVGQVEALEAWRGAPFPCWLKIDTGMHRLGFLPGEALAAHARLLAARGVDGPPVLMTHLANAQMRGHPSVRGQVRLFDEITERLPGERSIANSAGLLTDAGLHREWVRPGLALYGVNPFEGEEDPPTGLAPVMHFASGLIAVRDIPRGGSIGYGGSFTCPVNMRIGIVAAGYGDGYPPGDLTGAPIRVAGVTTRVLGRTSMDMLAVDLTPVPDAREGDPVELWGGQVSVAAVARHARSLPWALLCAARLRAARAELQPIEGSVPEVEPPDARSATGRREA